MCTVDILAAKRSTCLGKYLVYHFLRMDEICLLGLSTRHMAAWCSFVINKISVTGSIVDSPSTQELTRASARLVMRCPGGRAVVVQYIIELYTKV